MWTFARAAPDSAAGRVDAALQWVRLFRRCTYIWVDAKNVVSGVQTYMGGHDFRPDDNHDLWRHIRELLQQLPATLLQVFHVPSHMCWQRTTSPFEDWLAEHNGHADRVAGTANNNRSVALKAIHEQAVGFYRDTSAQIRALRSIYVRLAKRGKAKEQPEHAHDDLGPEGLEEQLPAVEKQVELEQVLSVNWHLRVMSRSLYPSDFVYSICDFIFKQDSPSAEAYRVTWLEFMFMLEIELGLCFPVTDQRSRWCTAFSTVFKPAPPTVAGRLRIVRDVAMSSLKTLGLEAMLVGGLDLLDFGVRFRLDGFIGGVNPSLLNRARSRLAIFCRGRNMRS